MTKKFYTHQDALTDGPYRYLLTRVWAEEGEKAKTVTFIMLNPSTADADIDDPTVRRCVSFAEDWGFNSLLIANLFAFRTSYPAKLLKAEDPIGPGNLRTLAMAAKIADQVVCAWGDVVKKKTIEAYSDHFRSVCSILGPQNPQCLGTTKHGAPKHPLYLPADQTTSTFEFAGWEALGVLPNA